MRQHLKWFGDAVPPTETPLNGKRLDSWKEIAAYLNREVRTAMRWEKERGLPIHRIPGKRSGVYALTAEVDAWLRAEGIRSNGAASPEVLPPVLQPTSRKPALWMVVSAVILLIGIATALLTAAAMSPATPRLRNQVQITNDGLIKDTLMFGGRTLYFAERDGERWAFMRHQSNGQTASPAISYSQGALWPQAISPDESEILALQGQSITCPCQLGVVRISDGSRRKLADGPVGDAAWSPDGQMLAYSGGSNLYLASRDGTAPRKLATLPGSGRDIRWSPDGRRLRFIIEKSKMVADSGQLWELPLDHPIGRQVLPGWSRTLHDYECAGRWTPNGDFFVFAAIHDGTSGIWAIQERRAFYDSGGPAPIRLTSSTEDVNYPTPSPDGKKIFAIVRSPLRGEVIRYEPKVGQFVTWPGMPGLSAGHVAFSPDGHRAAYVSYPEFNLWTINADGSEKRQLTFGDSRAAMPQWSQDCRQIAYMGWSGIVEKPTRIRLISSDGGPVKEPVTWPGWQGIPTWTPDGKSLIFGENGHFNPIRASCTIHRFDLMTGLTSDLSGTTGLWTARACPTGRYVAATTRDNGKLVLYDILNASVTDLVAFPDSIVGDNPTWSKDGKFIYIDAPLAADPAVYRIRIADRHRERVASLKGIQRANNGMDHWIGLTPDGSPLITRRVQGSEIYAWDWVSQ